MDNLSAGSVTAITLAAANQVSAGAVANAWSNGTSATVYSATNVSSVAKTAGLSVHPSTTTYGWTVSMVASADLKALDRSGMMFSTGNTK